MRFSPLQTGMQKRPQSLPIITSAVKFLIILHVIGTILVTIFGSYSQFITDGKRIFIDFEIYRIFTGIFVIGSLEQLVITLFCYVWIIFTVSEFEQSHSTLYTIWHFWVVNVMLMFNVASLFNFFYVTTTLLNFNMIMGGIYPYCFYMHLKKCLNCPDQTVNYCFLPFPISRWSFGCLLCFFSLWFSTQSQACILITVHFFVKSLLIFINNCLERRCRCFSIGCLLKDGPMFPYIFKGFDMLVCDYFKNEKGFITMEMAENGNQSTVEQVELEEEIK